MNKKFEIPYLNNWKEDLPPRLTQEQIDTNPSIVGKRMMEYQQVALAKAMDLCDMGKDGEFVAIEHSHLLQLIGLIQFHKLSMDENRN